ncbi:MAG TPA: hypothetical protein VMS09_17875 [Paenibacillus sp.]|uniref:glycine zipper domain-containing protein n=1 Tax=Paenibacillus sp. TaxID=58172 RepID=UPI0028D59B59|nr:hypothetical protein [Paenibacillus sp.]HUC93857.1 hypothetical protein [Paenibacillus sp.]
MPTITAALVTRISAVQTTENVTGAIGVMAGVEYGAILGTSLMPGIGTAIGAVAGGMFGDRIGRVVGHRTGDFLLKSDAMRNMVKPMTQDNL